MTTVTRFALPWILLLAAGACAAQTVPMHELARGTHSQFLTPAHWVIRDAQTWTQLWRAHLRGAPPSVDFARDMVLGVALGERPSGGYGVRIAAIERGADDALIVTVRAQAPPAGAMTSQAFTQPFHFVCVAREDAPVAFQRREAP